MNAASSTTRLKPGVELPTEGGHAARVRSWRGEGSYARVYAGQFSRGGEACAVKVAKGEIPEAASRLEGERRVLEQLRHPHIVTLLDAGRLEQAPFLVLEWLEGETLRDLIQARRRLALRQSLEILEAASAAVAHIHDQSLSHGDIRAENLIIVPSRCAVLTDPGLGGAAADDVRALGGLLHQMLTGAPAAEGAVRLQPSAGFNKNVVQLWDRTQAARPPAAAELLAEVRRLRSAL